MSELETKQLSDVSFDPRNPRTITNDQYKILKKLLETYGDLSGIVLNVRTGQLVGGHMRVRAFLETPNPQRVIEQRFETPNSVGTVARGYVKIEGFDEPFTYREVDWDEQKQAAANLAANKAGGVFDNDKLAQQVADLDPEYREMTGFIESEINDLLQQSSLPEDETPPLKDNDRLVFKLTNEQRDTVERALQIMKSQRDMNYEEGDANGAALFYICQDFLENNA